MNRQDVTNTLLASEKNNILLELPTSYGKSKLALDKLIQWYNPNSKILIVIPRNVLIANWIEEIKKWNYSEILNNITFSTYVSIPKQDTNWDIVLYDETHHLSERCRDTIQYWNVTHNIFLSATIKRDLKYWITNVYRNIEVIRIKTYEAIEEEVLPELKIYLFPLHLEGGFPTCTIFKNPKGKLPLIETSWATRWSAWRQKIYQVKTYCTERQYYDDLSSSIEWYKKKAMCGNQIMKNKWLQQAGERLKWLSNIKSSTSLNILKYLKSKNKRVLTFCSTIDQSEIFGKCVNSKVGISNLHSFNEGKINNITAVGMLDEGISLVNCQIGIFNMLNSSERLSVQRIGRILRHKNPIIIIPYYKNTREEEIVNKMLEGYNKDSITIINNIKDFKI